MSKKYSIREVSALLNMPASTLRYYDSLNIIPNMQKNKSGVREFTNENIVDLRIIECLKACGMRMKDIQSFMKLVEQGDNSLETRLEIFKEMKQNVLKEISNLEYTLSVVNFKIDYYTQAVKDGTEKKVKATRHMPLKNTK